MDEVAARPGAELEDPGGRVGWEVEAQAVAHEERIVGRLIEVVVVRVLEVVEARQLAAQHLGQSGGGGELGFVVGGGERH